MIDNRAACTNRQIPDIRSRVNFNHRMLDYWITQVLPGHGGFCSYSKRFRIRETEDRGEVDTVEHTVFEFERWDAR